MVVTDSTGSVASLRIADGLRRAILAGEFAPGERMRQEVIATRFGASRLPVREALRILQSDGLVTLVANSGAWVSQLDERECAESYEIRERLEPLLLRESMPGLTAHDIAAMRRLAEEMERKPEVETFLRLDREFHLLSYSRAETVLLSALIERLWNTTQHYRRAFAVLVGADGRRVVHYEHFLLVDAIQRGDAEDAQRVLGGHIRRTRLELAQHPEVFG
ncbi:MAG: GntR family transcriptional regulator [Aeromicrobium sp.]|jgi:DNA-binding GntR family transcriptional regulator|nr:GntR family transcriptional regulator [Aeromicrobium sp.]